MEIEGSMAFRFTSPRLAKDALILKECPVGAVLREAPHVYDLINASAHVENAGLEFLSSPLYFQQASGIVGFERARLMEISRQEQQAKRDGARAHQIVRARNG